MQYGFARCLAIAALLCHLPALADAPSPSPAGKWKTFDDASGNAKSVVTIWEANGTLAGKVEKVLDASRDEPNPKCSRCEGDLKDQPIIGLRILRDLKKDGDRWSGGTVLDPSNGQFYSCTISLEDGGSTLKLRGYIGFSLLGRTQRWSRVP